MIPVLAIEEFPGAEHIGEAAGEAAGKVVEKGADIVGSFVGDPKILAIGLGLVVLAVIIIFFLKHILINSVLGIALWAILVYVFEVDMPFVPSLVLSIVFGLAGVGSILVLKFLGIAFVSFIPLLLPA